MKPWETQGQLKKEQIPNLNDLNLKLQAINSIRDASLLILTYLTAGRICELVRYNRKGIVYPSVRKKDFLITDKHDRKVLLVFLRNEKNKTRPIKEIPVPLDKQENMQLLSQVFTYIKSLELDQELFPFGYKNALKILKKTGFNPHFIRHMRLTHLVTIYDFSEQDLKMFAGWTDGRPSKYYIEMKWGDLLRKL